MGRPAARPCLVALDVGGVLADVDMAAPARVLGLPAQLVERGYFGSGAHRALALGRCAPDAFIADAAARMGVTPAAARAAWCAIVRVTSAGQALVQALHGEGHRVHLWSNIDALHLGRVLDALGGERSQLSGATASCRLGAAKPEAGFWQGAVAHGAPAVFLDDQDGHVRAAAAAGIRAHAVRGSDEAHLLLSRIGLLPVQGEDR